MISAALEVVGVVLLVAGLALWSVPLALVVGGLFVLALGVLLDMRGGDGSAPGGSPD